MELTRGAIPRIFSREAPSSAFLPILQVLDLRPLGAERFTVQLTDGEYTVKAVCGVGPLHQMVANKQVDIHSLLKLTQWALAPVQSKKEGRPQEVLAIGQGEPIGVGQPVNPNVLRKYPDPKGGSMLSQTQAAPNEFQQAAPLSNATYTTPDKRVGVPGMDQRGTPPAVSAPSNLAPGAQSGTANCVPAWGPTDSLAEAATQDPGLVSGASTVTARGPFSEAAVQNPYSAAAAAAASAPSTATGFGAGLAAATSPAAFGGNPYSAAAAAAEASHAQQSAHGARINQQPLMQQPQQPLQQQPQQFGAVAARAPSPPRSLQGGLGQFGFRSNAANSASAGSGLPGSSQGAVSQNKDSGCMPITELSPYTNGRWRIKARVLSKSDVRKFNNSRGEGQLFKVDLVDRSGGEITATFFGRAVDKYFEMIRQMQVYYFSRGSVKMGNPRFDRGSHVITFDDHSVVEAAPDGQEIPGVQFTFRALSEVESTENNTLIDVKAVISDVREVYSVNIRRDNSEKLKRDLVLWDDSGADGSTFVEMTIWGPQANGDFEAGTVMYAKGCRVSEWNNNKTLNCGSHYELNPDSPEAFTLRRKFDEKRPFLQSGMTRSAPKMAGRSRETIEECREADIELGPPAVPGQALDPNGPRSVHRHYVMATITQVPTDRPPFYQACPEIVERPARDGKSTGDKRQCNRKTMQEGEMWRCNMGHACQRPVHRYLCNRTQVVDHTGSFDTSIFDEAGRSIFGCEADAIAECWDNPLREADLERMIKNANWKRMIFRISSKKETWQDEERLRLTVEEAVAPNYANEAKKLLAEVKAAVQDQPAGGEPGVAM